jgi:hypothetical protein
MSVDFSVRQIDWTRFEEAVRSKSLPPYEEWEETDYILDCLDDCRFYEDTGYALFGTEAYVDARPKLPQALVEPLDRFIGATFWNCDVKIGRKHPKLAEAARINPVDIKGAKIEYCWALLSPETVSGIASDWKSVKISVLRKSLNDILDDDIDDFDSVDDFVDYIEHWGSLVAKTAKKKLGLLITVPC